jgi:hypothetical protein
MDRHEAFARAASALQQKRDRETSVPSAEASTKPAGQVSSFALATCCLPVPVGELEDLYAYFVREMHEHEQIAAACNREHQKHERFKRTGKAAACYDASVRVRLLIDRAKERQPADNGGDERRSPERPTVPRVPHTTENPQR